MNNVQVRGRTLGYDAFADFKGHAHPLIVHARGIFRGSEDSRRQSSATTASARFHRPNIARSAGRRVGAWMFSRRKAFLEDGYVGGLRAFVPGLGLVGDLGAVAKGDCSFPQAMRQRDPLCRSLGATSERPIGPSADFSFHENPALSRAPWTRAIRLLPAECRHQLRPERMPRLGVERARRRHSSRCRSQGWQMRRTGRRPVARRSTGTVRTKDLLLLVAGETMRLVGL